MSKATHVVIDGVSYPLDDTTAVDFSEAQSLSTAEKQQARTNIGAGSAADITTIQALIGNTALPTTAQTITGAIAEHETDISDIKSAIGTVPSGSNLQREVDDLKSAIDEVYKFDILRKGSDVTYAIIPYSLTSGKAYYICNDGNALVNVSTCDSSGTIIEIIKNSILVGEIVPFTATQDTSYIRLYASGNASKVSISTDGNVLINVEQEIKGVSDEVKALADDLGVIDESVTLETISGSLLLDSGEIRAVGGVYCVGKASVEAGAKYLITASCNFNNPLWGWFDSNMDLISIGKSSEVGSTYTVVTDEDVTAPTGAAYIVINWSTSSTAAALKKKNAKIAGKWYGKKWVCVGDSLTEENIRTTKHYFDYVADSTDITVVNMGVSGTGYKNAGGVNNPFYTRVLNVPTDADVVTIFGSFNDGIQDLGTADDTGTSTIGGCINTTLDNLYSVIPTVQLGIVSPTPWDGANPYDHPWSNAYVELLETICKKRSIPFLNLYYKSNLRPWNSTFRTLAYSKDGGSGVHPDETGHRIIAPRFEGFLDTLLLA